MFKEWGVRHPLVQDEVTSISDLEFCMRDVSILSIHIFLNHYFYRDGLTHIYFIFSLIIQYYFVPAWALGSSFSWFLGPYHWVLLVLGGLLLYFLGFGSLFDLVNLFVCVCVCF